MFESHLRGHMFRDAETFSEDETPSDEKKNARYIPLVIVGGGISGLTAAWRLLAANYTSFVLLELDEKVGGTSKAGSTNGIVHPWGAHYVTMPFVENRAMFQLLSELHALEPEGDIVKPLVNREACDMVKVRAPEERLYAHGSFYEGLFPEALASQKDLDEMKKFQEKIGYYIDFRDDEGKRAFTLPRAYASQHPELKSLDKLNMKEWMDHLGFTSNLLRWYVDYACRDDYGADYSQVSAYTGIMYYASRRRSSSSEAQAILTWPQGNGRIVDYFENVASSHIETDRAVFDIRPIFANSTKKVEGKKELISVSAKDKKGELHHYLTDHVIFSAPQFIAKYIISDYRKMRPAHLDDFEYGSWVTANLHVKDMPGLESHVPAWFKKRGELSFAWDTVLLDSPSLGYVAAKHELGVERGENVLTYYYALTGPDPKAQRFWLLETSYEHWQEFILSDLEKAHPHIRALCTNINVCRWGHAMIKPKPGFMFSETLEMAKKPYKNIHFACTDLSGVALFDEAFYHGIRASEEILTALSAPFSTLL